MKIGIIGTGISGLAAAYFLSKKYEVHLFEQNSWIGGHTHTVEVSDQQGTHAIDTGFIVCNKLNYPNFFKLLDILQIETQTTQMSFSVKAPLIDLEYAGTNLGTIFAQPTNVLNYNFWQMLYEINKFNQAAKNLLSSNSQITLQEFVDKLGIHEYCQQYYILPLVASIWSTGIRETRNFPAVFLFRFLDNHRLLDLSNRPQWYSIKHGSKSYVEKICANLQNCTLIKAKVNKVTRANTIKLDTSTGQYEFDKVIFATHSDEVLEILNDISATEFEILSKMQYQVNEVVLHTDTTVLPKTTKAWASWNYLATDQTSDNVQVTYNMNILQNLNLNTTYCVSLNMTNILNPNLIVDKFKYSHPVYTPASVTAQSRWAEISGQNNTYFCGAYWGYGFHEDGLNSALQVIRQLDQEILCKTPFM